MIYTALSLLPHRSAEIDELASSGLGACISRCLDGLQSAYGRFVYLDSFQLIQYCTDNRAY